MASQSLIQAAVAATAKMDQQEEKLMDLLASMPEEKLTKLMLTADATLDMAEMLFEMGGPRTNFLLATAARLYVNMLVARLISQERGVFAKDAGEGNNND